MHDICLDSDAPSERLCEAVRPESEMARPLPWEGALPDRHRASGRDRAVLRLVLRLQGGSGVKEPFSLPASSPCSCNALQLGQG